MDHITTPSFDQEPIRPHYTKHATGLSTAAFVIGIIALCTSCCLYIGLPGGALAILFAILSKGGETTMDSKATIGLWLGVLALVCTIVLYIAMFVISVNYLGGIDEFWEYYKRTYEMYSQAVQ